jgi:hypothetical protein
MFYKKQIKKGDKVKFLNKKAQSFDVFKLLIAGVVAITILALLLGIIRMVVPPGYKPADLVASKTGDMVNNLYTITYIGKTTFEKNDTLTSYGVAAKSEGALRGEQIYFYVDGNLTSLFSGLTGNTGTYITYTNPTKRELAIYGVCGVRSELIGKIDTLASPPSQEPSAFSSILVNVFGGDSNNTPTNACTNNDELCCIIAIKPPSVA